MASRAGHIGGLAEVAAAFQQPHLVAMDVRMLDSGGLKRPEVLAQRLAGHVGKGRREWLSIYSVVTECAEVDLAIEQEGCRVEDRRSSELALEHRPLRGVLRFERRMFRTGPVVGFAANARLEGGAVEVVGVRRVRERAEIARVALHARRVDGAREVRGAIVIARAVDPAVARSPIAYGEFEELIALPIQPDLAALTGAGNDVDALALPFQLRVEVRDRGLVKVASLMVHGNCSEGSPLALFGRRW